LGKVRGDNLQCPYHGLVFDRTGSCIANPNGKGTTPQALSVPHYPTFVRNGMIWIWPGDTALAKDVSPPVFDFLDDPGGRTIRGSLHVGANYELVTDNLLDLSHAEFLHPFIAGPGDFEGTELRTEQNGDTVIAYHSMPRHSVTPLFRPFFDESVTVMDGRANLHWQAPANMMLDVGATHVTSDGGDDVALPQVHLLTPETETSTHYFWAVSRTRLANSDEFDRFLKEGITYAFEHEDEPMVCAVAERMGGKSLFDLRPALLPQDEGAVRARRILAQKISEEQRTTAEVSA
jgi:vanillate O-demethylase monooxygenase subunit